MSRVSGCAVAVIISLIASSVFSAENPNDWRKRKSDKEQALAAGTTNEDVAEEVRFGREIAARIVGRYGLYKNEDLAKYVAMVGKSVSLNTDRQEIEFRFAVLNTDEVNAYAAPGGYVFITHGALAHMRDEAELAGVLAHEIAHVTQRHVVKELNIRASDASAASGLARLIGGTSEAARTAFSQAVEKALDMLFKDGYKREDEIEADKTGVTFAALSGYDPTGLPRYLERIGPAKEKNTEILDKTHPAFGDRVAWLKEKIAADGLDAVGTKKGKDRFGKMIKNPK